MSKEEKHPLTVLAEQAEEAAEKGAEETERRVKAGEGEFDPHGRYFLDGVEVTNYLPNSAKERAKIREKSEERSANANQENGEVLLPGQVENNLSPSVRPGGAETGEFSGPAPQPTLGDSNRDSETSGPKESATKKKSK